MSLVVEGGGPALVVDRGRRGRLHEGVPASGPLVPQLYEAANRAVGNEPGAAALEVYGPLRVRVEGAARRLSVDGHLARSGPAFGVPAPSDLRVRYLAIEGGLDVPLALGARTTLLVAGLGGHNGRLLRPGDRLPLGAAHGRSGLPTPPALRLDEPIAVVPGPDELPDALAALLAGAFSIAAGADRTGTRLEGPRLPAPPADALSHPMVPGAIEVTPAGEAIVLGPDHPTTGGYAIVACVARADLGRLLARRPGATVRFSLSP